MHHSCPRMVVFKRLMCEIRSYLNRGTLDQLYHRRNVWFLSRWWNIGDPGKQTCKSLPTQGCFSKSPFTRNKPLRQQVHKTLIHSLLVNNDHTSVLPFEMLHSRKVNHHLVPWIGTLWNFSVILSVVLTTIDSLFHFGRFGFVLLSVCQFPH